MTTLSLTVPEGPVHGKGAPAFLNPKGILMSLKRLKGGADGCLLHIRWVDRNLAVALPQVNLGKKLCNPRPSLENQACWAAGRHPAQSPGLRQQKLPHRQQLLLDFLTM
jgi:hypothetical protein